VARKKPCRICGKWFEPSPYAGARQRVCGDPGCQQERRRRSMAAARKAKPTMDAERRLRKKLRRKKEWRPTDAEVQREVVSCGARDAAIAKGMVVLEEHCRLLGAGARDAAIATMAVRSGKPRRQVPAACVTQAAGRPHRTIDRARAVRVWAVSQEPR
jgi:hypothetical protein